MRDEKNDISVSGRKERDMKKREASYKDYGFEKGEAKRLIEYCRADGFQDQQLLSICCASANPCISKQLFSSIVSEKATYDRQIKKEYIPLARADFYGYRRLTLSIFRNFLLMYGKWE